MQIDELIDVLNAAKTRGVKTVHATWQFVAPEELPEWVELNYKEQRVIRAMLVLQRATQQELQKQLRVKNPNKSHPGIWRILHQLEHKNGILISYEDTSGSSHKRIYGLAANAAHKYGNEKISAKPSTPTTAKPVW